MKARSDKCPSCGKQHVPGFAFCQRCGVPLGAVLGDDAPVGRQMRDADEEEATDLNGRILHLLERGKRTEAIRLYYEVLGGDIKVAEAAIDELAKNIEFAEVGSASAATEQQTGGKPTGWFNGWITAIRTLMGFDRVRWLK